MICIAAFIVLLVIWLFTPILRLFGKKTLANNISNLFKKSTHCFSRRVTLRACDSNFKDEIKDTVLSKLIVKHKRLIRPVSIGIEVSAFLIILITILSTLTVIKSGLSLYVYGTCNVKQPASCSLSTTKACTIDSFDGKHPVKDWFTDWGEIVTAIPARVKSWDANEYKPKEATFINEFSSKKTPNKVALDIFDPGCSVCRLSFSNQLKTGFFDEYKTYLIPYVITGENGDKFKNSRITASYIEAARGMQPEDGDFVSTETIILTNLFTKKNDEGLIYQDYFNGKASENEVRESIESWLEDEGFTQDELDLIREKSQSKEIKETLKKNKELVEETIKTKRIPTMIYDNKKHEGLFSSK